MFDWCLKRFSLIITPSSGEVVHHNENIDLMYSVSSSSCTMCIHWGIDVSLEGEVRPKLDLVMKIPEEGMAA